MTGSSSAVSSASGREYFVGFTHGFVSRPKMALAVPTRCDRVVAVAEDNAREAVPERWNAVGAGSDIWMDMAQDPRFAAGVELEGERATLLDYLRAYRLTMEMKCADLDAAQLARRSVPPSTMSLLGLVRHMADVERNWFRRVMAQADAPRTSIAQREVLVHMIEEYARHCGHADLLRERIDGRVGQ